MSSISYEELTPGYEFPLADYELSRSLISKYLEAVDSELGTFVPPLAIAAYAMTAMSRYLSLPPGSIHASQELDFFKPVSIGDRVKCKTKVARKLSRGQMCMLVVEMNVLDEDGGMVQSGKATVILPT